MCIIGPLSVTISCEIVLHGITENYLVIEIFLKIILNLIILSYSFYSIFIS